MNGDEVARIAYLGLLGAAIAGYYLLQNRQNLGRTAQYAAVWGLIFVGVVAVVGLWTDIRQTAAPFQTVDATGRIEVPRGFDGHFHLSLDVDGVTVPFVIDTGASQIVLSQSDARRVGLDPDALSYLGMAQTANGMVRTAAVTLKALTLEGQTERDVRAVVNEGEIDTSLLGMAYLDRFSRITIEGDRMILDR